MQQKLIAGLVLISISTMAQAEGTEYNKYLVAFDKSAPQDQQQSQLEKSAAKLSEISRINGDSIKMIVNQTTGEIEVVATPSPDFKPCSLSSAVSTNGPRYSGGDILTISGGCSIGVGRQVYGSYIHAFSDLRKDSEGGSFDYLSGGVKQVRDWGTLNLNVSGSDYRQGGKQAVADIGLTGNVTKADLSFEHILTANLTAIAHVGATRNQSKVEIIGVKDVQTYGTAGIGARFNKGGLNATLMVDQGLGGNREGELPLLGSFDEKYSKVGTNLSYVAPLPLAPDFTVELRGTAEAASKDAPTNERFAIGGVGRGSSYSPASSVGEKGFAYSAQISSPNFAHKVGMPGGSVIQAFTGVDGGVVKPSFGDSKNLSSAFIGLKGAYGAAQGSVSVAKALDKTLPGEDEIRLNFVVGFSF